MLSLSTYVTRYRPLNYLLQFDEPEAAMSLHLMCILQKQMFRAAPELASPAIAKETAPTVVEYVTSAAVKSPSYKLSMPPSSNVIVPKAPDIDTAPRPSCTCQLHHLIQNRLDRFLYQLLLSTDARESDTIIS